MSDAPVAPESPQNLLAQMERMLAALSADLVQLDAELQPPAPRTEEHWEGGAFNSEAGQP
ncbi:hypothetical protein ABH931_002149 [Streptacidiphilus sp. MAP12-33]|uniref:hypothetical protein n=1 Tax=Streptacidiphilus sp. MAP12-33 TaxID=3156266 RepID=UPI003515D818